MGTLASAGASAGLSAAIGAAGESSGAGDPPDLSSQTAALESTFQSSGRNNPQCVANFPIVKTLLVGGAFLVHFSGFVHLGAADAGLETGEDAAWLMFGAGVTAIAAGAYIGYQSCIA